MLAALYLTCGRGFGIGGAGKGDGRSKGPGSAVGSTAGPRRCAIRLSRAGLPDVIVTGDARQGDWDELRAALEAANIPIYKR